ncbi:MAG: hypothetical protein OHK005_02050 [Candidatus Methylacidiphilales bacterium]
MSEENVRPSPEVDYQKRLRPKTYAVAIYVVGLFVLMQLVALGLAFWVRQNVTIEKVGPALSKEAVAVVTPVKEGSENQKSSQPLEASPLDARPEGRLSLPPGNAVDQQVSQLNEDSRLFRRNSDFSMAEVALRQALDLKPNDLMTLTNYAMLEEARGNRKEALGRWNQVIATAPEDDPTIRLARERAILLEEALRLEAEARKREEALLEGIDRRITVVDVRTEPDPLPEFPVEIQRDFLLKSANRKIPVDASKLRVQVFVYDQIGGGRLEPAKIEATFLSGQPDFNRPEGETLRTTYRTNPDEPERKYYGYIVRVFYDNQLQYQRAEPRSLLELFSTR